MTSRQAGALLSVVVLVLGAALYWLPSHVATALGWNQKAMAAVVDRIEIAGLWLTLAAVLAVAAPWARPAAGVMLWPAGEALMGAAARLSLPMCCPLPSGDIPVAVMAWGEWAQWFSLVMAGAAVWWVAVQVRAAQGTGDQAHGHAQH